MLDVTQTKSDRSLHERLLQKELSAARLLNFDLPDKPEAAMAMLEARLQDITGTNKALILLYDEMSGTYRCLNDEKQPAKPARELTRIADHFLQDFLQSDDVIYADLLANGMPLGSRHLIFPGHIPAPTAMKRAAQVKPATCIRPHSIPCGNSIFLAGYAGR
jgi:hypothetical protein